MEIGVPTWSSGSQSYNFRILKVDQQLEQTVFYEKSNAPLALPVFTSTVVESFLREFLEKSKKYFTNPLTPEKIVRHLRHEMQPCTLPEKDGWYTFLWKPYSFTLKAGNFVLQWEIASYTETMPVIPAEFMATKSRPSSPAPEQTQESLRNIQIHDSLIPVGDLPLSDLPPLSFGIEEQDGAKEEIKRRIREARLKVQLAKLKAQRMEHKYYERYGQEVEDSEDSSEFSSDSEEEVEVPFERHSHA